MSRAPDGPEPDADLATMLAEMDNRLQLLQQELESVALPIARRPPEQRRAARPVAEPLERTPEPELEGPPAAPLPPIAPADILGRRAPRVTPAEAPPPAPQRATPAAPDELDPPPPAPRRPPRRISAAGRKAAPTPAPEPAASTATAAAVARTAAPGLSGSATPEAVVRHTILEAEEEARRVVDDARQRIAEIGARTRALLEHSLAEPAQAPPAAGGRRRNRSRSVKAARRSYQGTVIVEAGPFADVAQLSGFEDVLAAVPNVADVYIRTFEDNRAHFELSVVAPTPLIVELQARSSETLNVLAAGESDLRLDIVRAGA
jgi:hypothetical protein